MRYGLGRRHAEDKRDHKHLMPLTMKRLPIRGRKSWHNDVMLNQGQSSSCVGHAWTSMLMSQPKRQFGVDPYWIYNKAQIADEWPGQDYDGTSVRAAAKVLKKAGKLKSYKWAFDLKTTLMWLYSKGPVVVGTMWYTGMFEANKLGLIRPTGSKVGGHAYVLQGVNFRKKMVLIVNSWGLGWGKQGRAWIRFGDLDKLIRDNGEVCTAIE